MSQQSKSSSKRKLPQDDEDSRPHPKRQRIDENHNHHEVKQDNEDQDDEDLLIGPMSPRMLYRLQVCAEVSYDVPQDSAPRWTPRVPQYDFDAYLSDYLPVRFRYNYLELSIFICLS